MEEFQFYKVRLKQVKVLQGVHLVQISILQSSIKTAPAAKEAQRHKDFNSTKFD